MPGESGSINPSTTYSPTIAQKQKYARVVAVLSVIALLGGVALTLAAFEVLPGRANLISKSYPAGEIIGMMTTGLAAVSLISSLFVLNYLKQPAPLKTF